MPIVIRGSTGSFVTAFDHPLPSSAISAHQIAAVVQPGKSTIGLADKAKRQRSSREINDQLRNRQSKN